MGDTSRDRQRARRRIKQRKKRRLQGIWLYLPLGMLCAAATVWIFLLLGHDSADGSRKPAADVLRADVKYPIGNNPSDAEGEEAHAGDTQGKESPAQEGLRISGPSEEEAQRYEGKYVMDEESTAGDDEYYVQVGSWRNYEYAEEIVSALKEYYPGAYLAAQNGFFKGRIPGVLTKERGTVIARDIEKKFSMKPLIVLRTPAVTYDTAATLDDAVRPFIGTSYRQIDCYGLIVRGLTNQGVQYHGYGGLKEYLENLAVSSGRPLNAYLTGEGLVEAVGTQVFSKSLQSVSNPRESADEVYAEITPHLQEGLILSFSTPTRGHTGIVSRQEADWTYINSGLIDNQIFPGKVSKRVGEEFLKSEIVNWLAMAARRMESLVITLGRIDGRSLRLAGLHLDTGDVSPL